MSTVNTKPTDTLVRFNDGKEAIVRVTVVKNKYASLQSKACTYKDKLVAGITLRKITPETAQENWDNNVVQPWVNMVQDSLNESLPQDVLNQIESIKSASTLFDFDASTIQIPEVI